LADAWRKRRREAQTMCIRRLLEGWSIRTVSAHAMTLKSTVHDWWSRFQCNEWVGLVNESRRPHIIHRLPRETVARIIQFRLREGWCGEAITEHIQGPIGKPTTQGKIERFFQTFMLCYPRFNDLNQFREHYNNLTEALTTKPRPKYTSTNGQTCH
jgi:transposase InsO family protein